MNFAPQVLALSLAFVFQLAPATPIAKVCFSRGEYIFVKDMKTGVEKRLVKGSYPGLSPNGRMVAFSVDNLMGQSEPMSREIKLLDLDTGKVSGFPSLGKFLCYGALWSPDGSKLAFSIFQNSNWEIAVMDANNFEWNVITKKLRKSVGVSLNSWTHDGRSILCQDLDQIYQIGLNGEVLKTIPTSEVVDDISYISSGTVFQLSADGRYLLFDTDTLPDDRRLPMLWIYDLQLQKRTKINTGRLGAFGPQWLGGDDEILFTGKSYASRSSRPNTYRARRDGTGLSLIVANAEQPTAALGH